MERASTAKECDLASGEAQLAAPLRRSLRRAH